MSRLADTGALVLAAGQSRRFGGDKLLHPLQGKPLAAHIADTLSALPFACRIAVCPAGDTARAEIFAVRGFEVIENSAPDEGLGSSLALGAAVAKHTQIQRLAVFLADMPFIVEEHIDALLEAQQEGVISATQTEGLRHPPAVFPRSCFEILSMLQGDKGARDLLQDAAALPCLPHTAQDFDTQADFAAFAAREQARRVGSSEGLS